MTKDEEGISGDFAWDKTLPKTLRAFYRGLHDEGFDEIQSMELVGVYMRGALGLPIK